jgi:hypothetical protein
MADTRNNRVRKVKVSTGVITTVAGDGIPAYISDNVAATSTSLSYPTDVAVVATFSSRTKSITGFVRSQRALVL